MGDGGRALGRMGRGAVRDVSVRRAWGRRKRLDARQREAARGSASTRRNSQAADGDGDGDEQGGGGLGPASER